MYIKEDKYKISQGDIFQNFEYVRWADFEKLDEKHGFRRKTRFCDDCIDNKYPKLRKFC